MKFKLSEGNEGIYHQFDNNLGKTIEEALEKLREYSSLNKERFKGARLSEIVKDFTGGKHKGGLNVTFELVEGFDIYVISPDINRNSILMDQMRKEYFTNEDASKLLKKQDYLEGTIDIKTATVYGDYCKFESLICIGDAMLVKDSIFDVEEVTGFILHEIGHIFSYLETLHYVFKTDIIMNDAIERLLKSETIRQRVVILNEVESMTKTKMMKLDEIAAKARTKEAYAVVILNQVAKESKQELNVNIYEIRAWEQLADQFAARFGYYRALATGLDKIHKLTGHHEQLTPIEHSFMELFKLIKFLFFGLITFGITAILTLLVIGNPLIEEYDNPKERILKLKNQINDALKDTSLSVERKQKLLDDHAVIEKILEDYRENNTLYTYLWKSLTPMGRKQSKIVSEHKETERLLNNDLFSAATLIEL